MSLRVESVVFGMIGLMNLVWLRFDVYFRFYSFVVVWLLDIGYVLVNYSKIVFF